MRRWFRLPIDPYLVAILSTVAVASALPVRGEGAVVARELTGIAIGLLFFLYGARLSPQAAITGLRHWRLHLTVFASTFLLFPALGVAARVVSPLILSPGLYAGLLYLCLLPSTVQSSIAFTSIARGNVAAALCSASASNLIGIVLTPTLVGLLMHARGRGFSPHAIEDIVLQLLVPFLAGQALRPWIGRWIGEHRAMLGYVDRGSILLVVYTAFSEGVVSGIWHRLTVGGVALLIAVDTLLLAIVLVTTTFASRRLGFSREDEITIVFCGSKKSLASGLPMAGVLFPAQQVGLLVLPLMLFHQIQLIVCAALARRYAAAHEATTRVAAEPAEPAAFGPGRPAV